MIWECGITYVIVASCKYRCDLIISSVLGHIYKYCTTLILVQMAPQWLWWTWWLPFHNVNTTFTLIMPKNNCGSLRCFHLPPLATIKVIVVNCEPWPWWTPGHWLRKKHWWAGSTAVCKTDLPCMAVVMCCVGNNNTVRHLRTYIESTYSGTFWLTERLTARWLKSDGTLPSLRRIEASLLRNALWKEVGTMSERHCSKRQ